MSEVTLGERTYVKKEDILQLVNENCCVNSVVSMYQVQGVTWEDAMMTAVYYLAKQNNKLILEVVRLKQYELPKTIKVEKKEKSNEFFYRG